MDGESSNAPGIIVATDAATPPNNTKLTIKEDEEGDATQNG